LQDGCPGSLFLEKKPSHKDPDPVGLRNCVAMAMPVTASRLASFVDLLPYFLLLLFYFPFFQALQAGMG
jgi:hypothetical protein